MSVLSMPPHHYLLVVHEGSGAAVWDLRAQIVVAVLSHSSNGSGGGADGSDGSITNSSSSSSKLPTITAAAWLPGSSKGDFATGHVDGSVRIWDMPESATAAGAATAPGDVLASKAGRLAGELLQQQPKALQAQLVSQLQSGSGGSSGSAGGSSSPRRHGRNGSRGGVRYRPVKSLEFVAGATECLAVFGGNDVDRPDGLTLLPLPEPTEVRLSSCLLDRLHAACAGQHSTRLSRQLCGQLVAGSCRGNGGAASMSACLTLSLSSLST